MLTYLAVGYLVTLAVGVASAIYVIQRDDHRSRGAVAWVISLIALPWIAVPLYWSSGHARNDAYRQSRAKLHRELSDTIDQLQRAVAPPRNTGQGRRETGESAVLNAFGVLPTSVANEFQLYPGSEQAFEALLEAIGAARRYVLLESYLIRDDNLGRRIQQALLHASERGCQIFMLYDELGSSELNEAYMQELTTAGVHICGFSVHRRFLPHLRTNFRNHRKIIVVDGEQAFMGGLNIGDEYLDGGADFDEWRDTHAWLRGDAVLALQLCFLEDWYFANDGLAALDSEQLCWANESDTTQTEITICGLGPHQRFGSGDQLFTLLIESAVERLWIASPYFVPDDRVIASLKVAALRGVEVKVLVPRNPDHKIFGRVHRAYIRELEEYGIAVHYYEPGFMHQKVTLVDDKYAVFGSANFDNRSFRLNFEVVAVARDADAVIALRKILTEDFKRSTAARPTDTSGLEGWQEKLARLLAPIL